MGTVMFSGQVEYGDSVVFSQGFQLGEIMPFCFIRSHRIIGFIEIYGNSVYCSAS
jgi:hypothetical protein